MLEARDRVGGRTLNEPIGDGKVVEIGAQWVGPTQDRVLALIRELGLETFPTYARGKNIFEREGKLSEYSGAIPRANPVGLAEVGVAMKRLNLMAAKVSPEAPWRAPKADRWDSETFATWMRRNVRTEVARDILRLAIIGVWAAEPRDVSLLHVLFYIRSAGSFEILIGTEGGAQQDRVVGGTQLISLRMAEQLGPVVELADPGARDPSQRRRRDRRLGPAGGQRPPRDRRDSAGARRADRVRAGAAGGARRPLAADGAGQRGQVHGRLRAPVLARARALRGRDQRQRAGLGRVRQLAARTARPACCSGSSRVRRRARPPTSPATSAARLVAECFGRLFGPEAAQPIDYVDRAWGADPWSRGCYGGFMPTGAWTDYGAALREPIGPIHWAGAETAVVWNGYMDGAVGSGRDAARAALAAPLVTLRTRSVDTARATRAPAAATLEAMGRQPHEVSDIATLRALGGERALADLAARQHGVIAIAQLHELGWTTTAVSDRLAAGKLHRLYRGVYAVGHRGARAPRLADGWGPRLRTGGGALAPLGGGASGSAWSLLADRGLRAEARAAPGGACAPGSSAISGRERTVVDGIPCAGVGLTLLGRGRGRA